MGRDKASQLNVNVGSRVNVGARQRGECESAMRRDSVRRCVKQDIVHEVASVRANVSQCGCESKIERDRVRTWSGCEDTHVGH